MKKAIVLPVIFFSLFLNLHAQIIINEIMYAPSDASNEWFELFNKGNAPVNLKNWKWKDATSSLRTVTGNDLILDTASYILICQDSLKLKNQFQTISGKVIQTSWSQLNNTGDNVILIEPSGTRIDSVTFSSAWGGNTGGYSLERINPQGASNSSSNWSSSTDNSHATPCRQNSVTPKLFDLLLKSFNLNPLFPSSGTFLNLNSVISNIGFNEVLNFSFNVYDDINFDSIPQITEIIRNVDYTNLLQGDSITDVFSVQLNDTGSRQFIAKILFAPDNDTLNNTIIKRIYVNSLTSGNAGLVINEIMYDPISNQSEWVEFYNASGQVLNFRGWKFRDASTSILLSANDLMIAPGSYFILAHDSTIMNSFSYLISNENQITRYSASLSLNNSGESISVFDSLNNLIDEVDYKPDWNSSELPDTKGISLERINPGFASNDKSNWNSCADKGGGTPGLQNSIFTMNHGTNSTVSIYPNPFSPDGDGYEDFAIIKYKLTIPFGQMKVRIFDIKGRMVRTLSNNRITGNEGTLLFDGFDDNRVKLRVGIYILLIEAIDDKNGIIDKIKVPIVVAARL